MYLKTLEILVLKCTRISMASMFKKKTNINYELLTDYDMLLMVEEGIRGGICHSIKKNFHTLNI